MGSSSLVHCVRKINILVPLKIQEAVSASAVFSLLVCVPKSTFYYQSEEILAGNHKNQRPVLWLRHGFIFGVRIWFRLELG